MSGDESILVEVVEAIAALGGAVEEARIAAGDYHLTVHLSPSADLHHVIETVMETYPDADLVKRRQLTIRENDTPDRPDLTAALTDRQRMALNSALHAGFFEWPREATGEDVADLLDISPPTFHQHLRKAERSVFEELLTDEHSERHRFE
jgi:predicted DNA binding protein